VIPPFWRSHLRLVVRARDDRDLRRPALSRACQCPSSRAASIQAHPLALPSDFTTSNVVDAAKLSLVQTGLKTSLIITVSTVLIMVPLAAMGGLLHLALGHEGGTGLLLFFLLG